MATVSNQATPSVPIISKSAEKSKNLDGPGSHNSYSQNGLLRRIGRDHVKPYLGQIMIAVFLMIVVAATTAGLIYILDPAIKYMFLERDERMLVVLPIAAIIIAFVKAAATYGQGRIMAVIGQRMVADLQLKLFRTMVYADLSRLQMTHSGQFMANAINNVLLVQRAAAQSITSFAKDFFTVIGLGTVMYLMDWRLALIVSSIVPFVVLNARRQGKRSRKATNKSMAATGTLSTLISENLDGTRIVKAYGQEEREISRTQKSIEERTLYRIKAEKARLAAAPVTEALTGIGIAGALFYGGLRGFSGTLELNQFVTFIAAMMSTYAPLKSISNLPPTLAEGLAAASRVFKEIDTRPVIQDEPNAAPLSLSGGKIELKDVTFHYGEDAPALCNISIVANPGETVALVGPSGAGKSSILNLIPRFYDVSEGVLEIDGQDIRSVTLESLRHSMALVTQDPFLFDDTVFANIAYSRPEASPQEVEAAAKAADAHDFIFELPSGYDTGVGEGGSRLSGGQRQRIAIARAMLADTPILLLDEATSALDTKSEALVQKALDRLMANRTTIVIAHRLSTIMHADRIFVMDKGKIVETGTHSSLVEQGGLYTTLYQSSFRDQLDQQKEAATPLEAAVND